MFRRIEEFFTSTSSHVNSIKVERSILSRVMLAVFIMAIVISLPLAADRYGENLLTFQFNTSGDSLITTGPDFRGKELSRESGLVEISVNPGEFDGKEGEAVFYLPFELLRAIASKDLAVDIIASYEVSDGPVSTENDNTDNALQIINQNQDSDSVEASESLITSIALRSSVPKMKKVLHCHDHVIVPGNEWHCHEG